MGSTSLGFLPARATVNCFAGEFCSQQEYAGASKHCWLLNTTLELTQSMTPGISLAPLHADTDPAGYFDEDNEALLAKHTKAKSS